MPYMCLCMDPGYFTLVKRTSYHPCPLTIAQLYMSHLSHLFAVKVINNRCAWVPLDLASRHENLIMCADEIKQYREGRVYVWSVIVSLGYAHMCGRFLTLQSKVWQVEIGRTGSISWINVDTAHAITALVISWDALLLLSSSLMKMQSLLVRLIVYTGRLNASARTSMEQRKWEHVCVSMVVVVVGGGWCDAVGGWEDENLYKWKILFSLNIAFRLLIRCRGEATWGEKTRKSDGFIWTCYESAQGWRILSYTRQRWHYWSDGNGTWSVLTVPKGCGNYFFSVLAAFF